MRQSSTSKAYPECLPQCFLNGSGLPFLQQSGSDINRTLQNDPNQLQFAAPFELNETQHVSVDLDRIHSLSSSQQYSIASQQNIFASNTQKIYSQPSSPLSQNLQIVSPHTPTVSSSGNLLLQNGKQISKVSNNQQDINRAVSPVPARSSSPFLFLDVNQNSQKQSKQTYIKESYSPDPALSNTSAYPSSKPISSLSPHHSMLPRRFSDNSLLKNRNIQQTQSLSKQKSSLAEYEISIPTSSSTNLSFSSSSCNKPTPKHTTEFFVSKTLLSRDTTSATSLSTTLSEVTAVERRSHQQMKLCVVPLGSFSIQCAVEWEAEPFEDPLTECSSYLSSLGVVCDDNNEEDWETLEIVPASKCDNSIQLRQREDMTTNISSVSTLPSLLPRIRLHNTITSYFDKQLVLHVTPQMHIRYSLPSSVRPFEVFSVHFTITYLSLPPSSAEDDQIDAFLTFLHQQFKQGTFLSGSDSLSKWRSMFSSKFPPSVLNPKKSFLTLRAITPYVLMSKCAEPAYHLGALSEQCEINIQTSSISNRTNEMVQKDGKDHSTNLIQKSLNQQSVLNNNTPKQQFASDLNTTSPNLTTTNETQLHTTQLLSLNRSSDSKHSSKSPLVPVFISSATDSSSPSLTTANTPVLSASPFLGTSPSEITHRNICNTMITNETNQRGVQGNESPTLKPIAQNGIPQKRVTF